MADSYVDIPKPLPISFKAALKGIYKLSRIFKTTENIYNAVDSVKKFGYAAVDGTKTIATPYCERIIEALSVHSEISAITSYSNVAKQGYLYFVYDLNRFDYESAKRMIEAVDYKSSI